METINACPTEVVRAGGREMIYREVTGMLTVFITRNYYSVRWLQTGIYSGQ